MLQTCSFLWYYFTRCVFTF